MRWRGTCSFFSSHLLLYSCISMCINPSHTPSMCCTFLLFFTQFRPSSVNHLLSLFCFCRTVQFCDTPVSFSFVSVTFLPLYPLIIALS